MMNIKHKVLILLMSFGAVSFVHAVIFEVENASPSPKSVTVNFAFSKGRNGWVGKILRYKKITMNTKNDILLSKDALVLKDIDLEYNFTQADAGVGTTVEYSLPVKDLNIKTTDTDTVRVRLFDKGFCHIIRGGKIHKLQAEKTEESNWPMEMGRSD